MKNFLSKKNEDKDFTLGGFFNDIDDFFSPVFYSANKFNVMRTDVKENETGYELAVDLPGFDKKDINVELNDGYLTVSANTEEKEEDKFVRRERVASCSRSYYVGKAVTEADIKAKFENGVLTLDIPKKLEKTNSGRINID